jgi:hypothetical protein
MVVMGREIASFCLSGDSIVAKRNIYAGETNDNFNGSKRCNL